MKANQAKSVQVTFTLNKMTCPPVKLHNEYLPQAEEVKYLGIHLDWRLTWRKHITTKRKQSDLKLWNLYWITGRKSQLSMENKLLVYKVILKPVWTNRIQLRGTASNSNLEILEQFQSKVLCIITDAPWYVPNTKIKCDLQIPMVKLEARTLSAIYQKWLDNHPNNLANILLKEQLRTRRLKRLSYWPRHKWLTQQHPPMTTSIHANENRRENFTGSITYMPLTQSTQRSLNVSRQIVTNKEFKLKKSEVSVQTVSIIANRFSWTGI